MIIVSQTFEIVTYESAEEGEAAENGFDFENEAFGFRELVDYIERNGFINPSNSHGVPRWLSTHGDTNHYTGEVETKSLHPGRDARSRRYWVKACNVIKV